MHAAKLRSSIQSCGRPAAPVSPRSRTSADNCWLPRKRNPTRSLRVRSSCPDCSQLSKTCDVAVRRQSRSIQRPRPRNRWDYLDRGTGNLFVFRIVFIWHANAGVYRRLLPCSILRRGASLGTGSTRKTVLRERGRSDSRVAKLP